MTKLEWPKGIGLILVVALVLLIAIWLLYCPLIKIFWLDASGLQSDFNPCNPFDFDTSCQCYGPTELRGCLCPPWPAINILLLGLIILDAILILLTSKSQKGKSGSSRRAK